MQVWLSRCEADEWHADAQFRQNMVKAMLKGARDKGRKYLEIYDARGTALYVGCL